MSEAPARPTLVRAISRIDLTAAVVNAVIGSAIFALPAREAELLGEKSPLAYVFAGAGMLLLYLCFAEVAGRFAEGGGPYLYAREGLGSFVGFQAGWLMFWIRATAISANVNVFVVYAAELLPAIGTPAGRVVTLVSLFVLLAAVNVIGVRQATWAIDFITIAKLLPLVLLVAIGARSFSGAVLASQSVAHPAWTQAILLLVFAYGGFEAALIPAGEATDPRRDTAVALLTALAIVAAVYISVHLVVVGVVPHAASFKAPIAEAYRRLAGPSGAVFASLGAMVSTWGLATGSTLQTPRVLLAMATRGELPAVLGRIHPTFRTPHVAIVAYAAVSLAFALYGDFEWNAQLSAIVRLVVYGLTCIALLVLRRRSDLEPGFRLPLAWLVVPGALAFCLWLLVTRTFAQVWILVGMIGVGAVVWQVARLTSRPRGAQ